MNRACLGGRPAIWLAHKDHPGESCTFKMGKSQCLTVESGLYPLGSWWAIWLLEPRQDKKKARERGEREAASPSLPVSSVSTRVREVVSSFQQSYTDHLWWKVWTYWSHGARPENRRCHRAWEAVPTARHLQTCSTHSWERLAQLQGPEWAKPQPQKETFLFAPKSTYTSSLALLSIICSSWQWSWVKTGSVNHIQCFSQHCIGVACLSHMA